MKKILIILILINTYIFSQTKLEQDKLLRESIYISTALDSELNKKYIQAAIYYERAYKESNNYEYLSKSISFYKLKKHFINVQFLTNEYYKNSPRHQEILMQEYVYVSMILKEYDNALKMSKEMITLYDNANYYSLVADIYYTMKSYKRALKYYNISYSKKNNENVLLTISILNYTYLNNKENAILRLENYVKEHNCSKLICSKLFSYYRLNGDTDKMTTMLKTLYEKYKNSYTKDSALKISTLLIKLLEEKDINEAINFLEKNNIDNETLLRLYGETNQYDKAHKNLTKEYQETKNKNTLGKIAIVEFEMSKNKESILKKVFQKFDIALQNNMNDNANFENYYGYLLVDYNIDIKKGKKLIEKALSKYPNNYAYMDSIAWAYYKSKDCKNAYKYMSKVVKQVGLENEEIKEHWNKIKGCKK